MQQFNVLPVAVVLLFITCFASCQEEGQTLVDWYFYDASNAAPDGQITPIPMTAHRRTRHHDLPVFPGPLWPEIFPFDAQITPQQDLYSYGTQSSRPGDDCFIHSMDARGLCTALENCDWAQQQIKLTGQVHSCGQNERGGLVCCPSHPQKPQYAQEYQLPYEIEPQPPYHCGHRHPYRPYGQKPAPEMSHQEYYPHGSSGQPGGHYQQGSSGQPGGHYQQGSSGQPGGHYQQGSSGQLGGHYQQGSSGQPGGHYQQGSSGQPGGHYQQGSSGQSHTSSPPSGYPHGYPGQSHGQYHHGSQGQSPAGYHPAPAAPFNEHYPHGSPGHYQHGSSGRPPAGHYPVPPYNEHYPQGFPGDQSMARPPTLGQGFNPMTQVIIPRPAVMRPITPPHKDASNTSSYVDNLPPTPKPQTTHPGFNAPDTDKTPPVVTSTGLNNNRRNDTDESLKPFIGQSDAGATARKMCVAYERYAPKVRFGPDKDCVPNHSYPIGGNPALPTEFPHMAQLGVGRRNAIQYFCGGSLIAPSWVMTAAHCIFPDERPVQWVRLGDLVPDSDTDDSFPQVIEVVQRVVHPGYDAKQVYNDVALLRLRHEPNMTTPHVRPACLQADKELEKDKLNLIGFGITEENGFPAKELMEVALKRTPYEKCEKFFRGEVNLRQLPRGLDDDSQICAGLDQVGEDACKGDSGGPLNTPFSPTCMHHVAGITSFGQGCGRGKPGVYTRVSHFVPWIESIVWPDQAAA